MLIGALLLLAASAIASATTPTIERDGLGREVRIPDLPPGRIVPLFSSNTEIVAALGLSDRIVGIDAFTRYPPEIAGKAVVGGRLGFSVETIALAEPDLVLVTPARQAVHQLEAPLERLGIPVVVLVHRTVAEVLSNIRMVARLTRVPERGEALARGLEARLAAVEARVAGRESPRVLMITGRIGNGLLLVTRPGTYTGDAIQRAGGRLVPETPGLLPHVSPEVVLEVNPEVLLFAGSSEDLGELLSRPGWEQLDAVRKDRVHAVPRAELLIPGPRTIDGVERLSGILHPFERRR